MKNNLLTEKLTRISLHLTNYIETNFISCPKGACYLFGHTLAEGLKKAGFDANEVTGHLIVKDKHEKNIVYGSHKHNGKNIGYYHTWCVLNFNGSQIIIDPSLKYNRIALREYYNYKLNGNIPDTYISEENKTWLLTYIEDQSLVKLSKEWLNRMPMEILQQIINEVSIASAGYLN